jgi:signal transduction histidine kinase
LGLAEGKSIRSFPDFMEFVHPEDRDFIARSNREFLTNPDLVIQEFRLLVDGKTKYIKAAGQIVDDDSSPVFLGAITDVTELIEAHEKLHNANQKLVQSNADLEAFTYSISHDLKAPVRSMLMYIHLLLDKPEHAQSDEEKKWLNVLLRKGRHMDELIEGLLALSRYGSVSLRKQEINMADLVKDVVDEMIPEFPRTEISLSTPLGKVNADENLIRQVWINLIGNSLKFSEQMEKPRILISRHDQDGFAGFSIRDNGVGFEEERASELFTVFRRLHNEEFSGSGVGLAIVKRIIVSHGGDIEAHGELGNGSIFTFRLPK